MKPIEILFCAVLLAACQTTAKPAPEPHPTAVMAPGAEVPAEFAALSRVWKGKWGQPRDGNLAVLEISPGGMVKDVYVRGDHPTGQFQAGSREATGEIVGKHLTVYNSSGARLATYTLRDDGNLGGHYAFRNASSKGVFVKS